MKTTFRTLMMTAAIVGIAATAQAAETMISETTIKKTGVTYDEAAFKSRLTQNLEQALQSQGYDAGSVDGVYDAKTASAVRAYQRDNNMPDTGEASSDMLRGLGVDTTISSSYRIEQRDTIKYPLADKGSENANVYDDPNADRTATGWGQRYDRYSTRRYAPAGATVTSTTESYTYTNPVVNR